MRTQTQEEKTKEPFAALFGRGKPRATLDWAVFGCMVAGAVGIIKALGADSSSGVLLCLLGSVAAFGSVFYVHLRRH